MKKIRKRLTKCLVSVLASAMIVTSLPVNLMTTEAAQEVSESGYEVTSGTFGDNGGFSWSYDEENAILTVTGEDSGLNNLRHNLDESVLETVKNIVFQGCIVVGSMYGLLYEMADVETVEFIDVDTSNVYDMSYMFYNCSSLTSVNAEVLNTSSVTSMFAMFEGCSSLSNVDVSDFDTTNVTDMCGMFSQCNSLISVDVSNFDTSRLENISWMFHNCSSLTGIDLSSFDLTKVTESDSVDGMFMDCGSLTVVKTPNNMPEGQNIGLPGYFSDAEGNTMTEITSEYCNKELTKTGDFEEDDDDENDYEPGTFGHNGGFHWSYDEENATLTVTGEDSGINDLRSHFEDEVLKEIKKVVFQECIIRGSMSELLSGMSNVETVEFIDVDTSNVTDMTYMFYNCINLTSVNVEALNTGNVTSMFGMFEWCSSLSSVDVSGFDTANVTDMCGMFSHCNSLTSVDVSNFDTSSLENVSWMFNDCGSLTSIDLSSFDLTKVTESDSMDCMFMDCGSLTVVKTPNMMPEGQSIELPGIFSDSEGNTMTEITNTYCNKTLTKRNRPEDDDSGEDDPEEDDGENDFLPGTFGDNGGFSWSYDENTAILTVTGEDSGINGLQANLEDSVRKNVRYIVFEDCTVTGSMSGLLSDMSKIRTVVFNNVDTTGVTDMSSMFCRCTSLSSLNLSGFDTKNVTSMRSMFTGCRDLTSVNISGFDTGNVNDMNNMFAGCMNLTSVDVSDFDTSNVTDMAWMFSTCTSLTSVDVSSFDTTNVTDMSGMFIHCLGLSSIDVSGFDTKNVENISYMFNNCSGLTTIDLSSFETTKVTNTENMLLDCSNLETIKTPKNMVAGQSIQLPAIFSNSNENNITEITAQNCGDVLVKNVEIEEEKPENPATSGSFGDNGGFSWSYDEENATLTVTGEDRGLDMLQDSIDSLVLENVRNIVFQNCTVSGSMNGLLKEMSNIETVEFNNVDTSNVTDMGAMFLACSSLTSVNVRELDTKNVTNMNVMFASCEKLSNVDVSGFDTGNVTNMSWMFESCNSLTRVDVSGFDIGNVEDISGMFYRCTNLTRVDLSSFDTTEISNLEEMFSHCYSLVMIKTPKEMADEQYIDLPECYRDLEGNGMSAISAQHCNKVLVRDYEEATKEYTITYHLDGGTNAEGNPEIYTMLSETIVLQTPIKGGYAFGGWYTDNTNSNEITQIDTGSTGNIELYAQWTPNKYAIRFDKNGATGGSMDDLAGCEYEKEVKLTANAYVKTGYTFAGWNTAADGSGKSYADGESVENLTSANSAVVILYAQWTPNKYAIRFDKNGATGGSMDDLAGCEYEKEVKLTANAYVKTGYTFAGWNTAADGSGKSYADGATVENLASVNGSVVTLYAQWIPNKYSIKFDKNGATGGTMSDMTGCEYGKPSKLTANAYVKTGYTFVGWNTAADGSGKSYANGATVENLASANGAVVTLYAQWVANKYTIKFDKNGATGGTMSDMTGCEYGKPRKLTANAYVKTGYTFVGWNTAANGSGKSYANGATVENLASANGATVTLYAQWIANKYTIKFDKNGATGGSMSDMTGCEYGKASKLTTNAYVKTGYTFAGWNTAADGSGKSYVNGATVENLASANGAVVTLYAQWVANKYTIKFDKNGATGGTMSDMTSCEYGKDYKLTKNAFKRKGYTFIGWNTEKNGKGTNYANEASVKNLVSENGKSITLYAQWKNESYKITYKLNGGKNNKKNPSSYTVTSAITLKKPTKEGYTFAGWYKDSKFKTKVTSIKKGSTGNITLYAKWTANKYTIKFDGNGATSGKMKNLTNRKYGTSYKLTANKFKKKGYTFVGWNTKKNGKGKSYKNKASVKNLISTNGKTVVLYAQWKKNK